MNQKNNVIARSDSDEAISNLTESASSTGDRHAAETASAARDDIVSENVTKKKTYICDRCGTQMKEKLCKITCPNCGNRFDCSDLNIYFD